MNTNLLVAALIGLIVGAGGVWMSIGGTEQKEVTHTMSNDQAMDSMTSALAGKTGDAFDQAFLSEMIVHHEGAVDMAMAALQNAGRAEIKQMAEAIISAQTVEIKQMQEWQKSWYGAE